MSVILKIQNIVKSFGGLRAIDGVDLQVHESEILGIIGPNGAGKTTLIDVITGFIKPDSGSIEFIGVDVTTSRADAIARIGMSRTFQLVKPFGTLTALNNVAIGRLYGAEPAPSMKRARAEAAELLVFVGMSDKRDIPACNLTLADRRKLEIARALAARPRLLLLDEVIAGLNPTETEAAMETVRRIHELNIAVVFVEHVMKAVMGLSTKVVVLNMGKKIAEGFPEEIFNNPAVIESYLGGEI